MGCWLFRGETLIFKESVERPALFCADFKGVEFETVGYEYGGNVGNLLEKYWFLDSFSADLRGRKWDGTCRNF